MGCGHGKVAPEAGAWMAEGVPQEFRKRRANIPDATLRAVTLKNIQKIARLVMEKLTERPVTDNELGSATFGSQITWDNATMRHVYLHFTTPLTQKFGCSLAELVPKAAEQPPAWCVSHWWGERFQDVLALLSYHAKCHGLLNTTPYWLSAFALSGRDAEASSRQFRETRDVEVLPFARALKSSSCSGAVTLVGQKCTAFERAWVVLERRLAVRARDRCSDVCCLPGPALLAGAPRQLTKHPREDKAHITEHGTFPLETAFSGAWLDVATCKAWHEEDRQGIIQVLAGSPKVRQDEGKVQNHEEVNRALRAPFRSRAMCHTADVHDTEGLQGLLRNGLHGADEEVLSSGTPVHFASGSDARACLRLLLDARADPHRPRSIDGATPTFCAAQGNAHSCLKLLLDLWADPNRPRWSDGACPAHVAAESGSTDCLQLLLDSRANPNVAKTSNGATPAHAATLANRAECLQALTTAQADPNSMMTAGTVGATPVHVACQNSSAVCLQLLISARADLDRPTPQDGSFPLHVAVQQEDRTCLRVLLDADAHPDCVRNDGNTPTTLAVERDTPACLKLLLDANADPNIARASDKATPAHIASMANELACLRLLQAANADLNRVTVKGWSPLDHAQHQGFREVAQTLRGCGAQAAEFCGPPQPETGLQVQIVNAKGLRISDYVGKSDPFVVCEVCTQRTSHWKFQTKIVYSCTEPVWNHTEKVVEFHKGDSLRFDVLDKDIWPKPDDFLGTARLSYQDIYPEGFDGDLKLSKTKTGLGAVLRVKVSVLSALEPPRSSTRRASA